ncbi:MAG TPA: GIY-YIG nuclease family protein [Rhizomicrobium sp.]|nr:GIY-YIG nuclease family protein [Rhizomicrobium sp.]
MSKEQILSDIKRIAAANGGKAPGRLVLERETGTRMHEWQRYWARWNDAIREAGFEPNQKTVAYDEAYLIEKFISLAREVGHFPASSDLRLKTSSNPDFPTEKTYRRFGGKQQLVAHILSFAKSRTGYEDVIAFCEAARISSPPETNIEKSSTTDIGFVYLIKSGRFYKIGRSNAVGRRERELAIQLPEKSNTVHSIRTDDPIGIEAYWHKRFESKRKNGEWFELSVQGISIFRKRKFM